MADRRLTVRTLAMAMVALVLACVHAARGDGRSVASFTSGARSGSSIATITGSVRGSSSVGGVVTIRGEAWKPDSGPRTAVNRTRPARGRVAVGGSARGKGTAHTEPICIVRRASDGMPVIDPSQLARPVPDQAAPPHPQPPAQVQVVKPAAPIRNAFALTPTMGSGVP